MKLRVVMLLCFWSAIACGQLINGEDVGISFHDDCWRYTGQQSRCPVISPIVCGDDGECDIFEMPMNSDASWPELENTHWTTSSGYEVETFHTIICSVFGFCVREPDPNIEDGYLCVREDETNFMYDKQYHLVLNTGAPCGTGTGNNGSGNNGREQSSVVN